MIRNAFSVTAVGYRIVTAASERLWQRPRPRSVLKRLVERMEAGEFDAIIAGVGDGHAHPERVVRLTLGAGAVCIDRVDVRP